MEFDLLQLLDLHWEQKRRRETPTDLLFGTVLSGYPDVGIKIDNRFEVHGQRLILSALCKPLKRNTEAGDEVEIWRGLEPGDRVRMLQCSDGQQYYVLDREGDYNAT